MMTNMKSLSIYSEEFLLFPDNNLDLLKQHDIYFTESNMYFVLSGEDYKIKKVKIKNKKIIIRYESVINKRKYKNKIPLSELRIKNLSGLKAKAIDNDTNILIYSTHQQYLDYRKLIPLHQIILLTKHDEIYDVLYIGKSNPKKKNNNIYDRLSNHETILRIYREKEKYFGKKIMILIIKLNSKLKLQISTDKDIDIIATDSDWINTYRLGKVVNKDNLINLAEAIMIYYFQPKYNKILKKRPDSKLITYKTLNKKGINEVLVELTLYFENSDSTAYLKTKHIQTKNKHIIIKCNLDNLDNEEIVSIDYPDSLFDTQ